MKKIITAFALLILLIVGYSVYLVLPHLDGRHQEILVVGLLTAIGGTGMVTYYWNNPEKLKN
jgi:hypothetical protein